MKNIIFSLIVLALNVAALPQSVDPATSGYGSNYQALKDCVSKALTGGDAAYRIQTPQNSSWQDASVGAIIKPNNPALIAFANKHQEVADLVICANKTSYQAVPRSGRHHFEGWSALNNSLVIDVSSISYVNVSSDKTTAVVGAGTNLGWIYSKLAVINKTFLGGICPTVALGGYLGVGGYSLQHRSLGLAVDQIVSFKAVTAAGKIVTVSPSQEPELWFAARGGGQYALVLEATVKIVTLPRSAMIAAFFNNKTTRYEVIKKYLAAFPTAPKELTSQINVYNNRTHIIGWYLGGSVADLTKVVKASGLYDVPGADIQITGNCSTENSRMFWQDPKTRCTDDASAFKSFLNVYNVQPIYLQPYTPAYRPVPQLALPDKPAAKYWPRFGVLSKTFFTVKSKPLTDAVLKEFVDRTGRLTDDQAFWGEWTSFNISNPSTTGSFPWSDTATMLMRMEIATGTTPQQYNTNRQWLLDFENFFRPAVGNASYAGYIDASINTNPLKAFYGQNICRLIKAKAMYDPKNFFRNPFNVPPTVPAGVTC